MNINFIMPRLFIFDLQTFATPNTNVTTAATTGNNLSAEMKTFYDAQLLSMAGPNLVHAQFGVKQPIPGGRGKKVEWRKFSNFSKATTALTEGVTPDGNKLNASSIEATVSQYGDYTTISDLLELTAVDDVVMEATAKHGENAGLTLDTLARNELAQGTQVIYAPKSAGTAVTSRSGLDTTCLLTRDIVFQAAAQLKAMNAPKINGSYVCIIHPYVAYDLMTSDDWIDVHKYASAQEIFNGEIGTLGGVRFVESTEAKIWNDSTCPTKTAQSGDNPAVYYSVFGCLFLGKGAYGTVDITGGGMQTIIKQKGSAGSSDPLDQRSTVGWKASFATKILYNEYMVRVECCSSAAPTATAN